jgi:hypothetical protein
MREFRRGVQSHGALLGVLRDLLKSTVKESVISFRAILTE